MGAVCDNIVTDSYPNIEQASPNLPISNSLIFQNCEPINDSFLNNKLLEFKSKQEYRQIVQNQELRKHKSKQDYYRGQWDHAGYPKGKGLLYSPGKYLYTGQFDSVPHGRGVYEDLKGQTTYQGQFNHGRMQGHAKIYSHDLSYSFEGIIGQDKNPHTGTLTIQIHEQPARSCVVYLDNYPINKAKIQFKDGRHYEGMIDLTSFVPEGEGVCTYPNQCVYEGGWSKGEFHGKGRFVWPNHSQYSGDYSLGKKSGEGTFVYPSRKTYKGSWIEGKQQGKGTLFSASGQILKKGLWIDGVFSQANEQ